MSKAKYISISEQIEKGIDNGTYQEQLPGLYKLAEDYKTTHITISKALRLLEEKGKVTVNGTRGTFISQDSNFRKHRVIGVIGFSNNSEEMKAIERTASEFRYQVVALAPNYSFQKLLEESPEFLFKFPADGYIFSQSVLTSKLATVLRGNGIAFISLNKINEPVGVSWVDYDAEDNLLKALNKISSYGHRRIAYIEIKNTHYQYSRRMYKTYKEFMSRTYEFKNEYFFSQDASRYSIFNYYSEFADDAAEWLLGLKTRPTAVIIMMHEHTVDMIINRLTKAGMAIPEDMSIVAYSDTICSDHLATLYMSSVERAIQASRILLNQIKYHDHTVIQKFIDSEFHDGPSLECARPEKIALKGFKALMSSYAVK